MKVSEASYTQKKLLLKKLIKIVKIQHSEPFFRQN